MSPRRLLAVDIDGTLLRRDGTVHPDDTAAIARLRAAGVPVTIVTGRLYSGSSAIARRVGLEGPIACVDGSHIVDLAGDTPLFLRSIAGADASALRGIIARHAAASFLFAQDVIVHDAHGAPYTAYVRTWSPNIEVVDRMTDHPHWDHEDGLMAVVSVGREEHITAAVTELRERLGHAAYVISFPVRTTQSHAMVIRAAGATKGTALGWLAKHHGITTDEIVAVGDWLNDVPMFEVAGRSFVMGQAPAAVKAAATDHLEAVSEEGGGVAEAIRRVWGL